MVAVDEEQAIVCTYGVAADVQSNGLSRQPIAAPLDGAGLTEVTIDWTVF